MVGGTTQQHHQQPPQLAPPSLSKTPATTPEEEELLKRNTDCVYFLASPLTCKKGSECEYRHSDVARVNPRDCWYWLNGNCLNPKCGFRHPPLDGLLGVEVAKPNEPSVPKLHSQATSGPHATPYAMPKQGVACIFFQKGFCLKGHLCPFLHGPPSLVQYKSVQSGLANSVAKPAIAGPEKPVQEPRFTLQANVQKPAEFISTQEKQAPRRQARPPARNNSGGTIEKNAPPPMSLGVKEPPRYKSSSVVPLSVVNEISSSRSNRGGYHDGNVSDNNGIQNGKDTDGYSRELSPGFDVLVDNELGDSEYYHNVDGDMYREQHGYDHYNERDRQYMWEDQRAAGEAPLEMKRNPRNDSLGQFYESDLRHRISKQRTGNNSRLRSIVSHDHGRYTHAGNEHHRVGQGSLSSRLRGRIKIPGRSMCPGNKEDLTVERESDMGRQPLSRYSDQSRIRDRGSHGPRDMGSDKYADFTGPSLGKRKHVRVDDKQSNHDLSFEGPKPLSEILKRKRGIETTTVETDISLVNNEETNQKERTEISSGSTIHTKNEESKSVSSEKQTGQMDTDNDKSQEGRTCIHHDASELENEKGLIDEDAMLDQELEAYGHGGYEQLDGEDYNLDEGENPEEEYLYEEDGEDYTRKDSVVDSQNH